MGNIWSQFFVPSHKKFTEKKLPDQTGKVHIITGGYTGIGLELAKILYMKNATIYIAGRNESKFDSALAFLQKDVSSSQGRIQFLKLDLADQTSIKDSADAFLAKETRLDVLVNNAGVMATPAGTVDKQGHDMMIGTNVLGPWLFTQYLLPLLKSTAASSPPGQVRVTWAGSLLDVAPKGGLLLNEQTGEFKDVGDPQHNYLQTKVANAFLASEVAHRYGKDGILSVGWNPGNLRTELGRHKSALFLFLVGPILYEPRMGAYTMLYAGWSPEIDASKNGAFVWPFGRIATLRPDLLAGMKSKEEGGLGTAQKLWEYCERECRKYL